MIFPRLFSCKLCGHTCYVFELAALLPGKVRGLTITVLQKMQTKVSCDKTGLATISASPRQMLTHACAFIGIVAEQTFLGTRRSRGWLNYSRLGVSRKGLDWDQMGPAAARYLDEPSFIRNSG